MAEPRRLSTADPAFEAAFARLIAFEAAQDEAVESATARILDDLRARGDAALVELTARFDRWTPASAQALEVPLESARRGRAAHPPLPRAAAAAVAARRRGRRDGALPADR